MLSNGKRERGFVGVVQFFLRFRRSRIRRRSFLHRCLQAEKNFIVTRKTFYLSYRGKLQQTYIFIIIRELKIYSSSTYSVIWRRVEWRSVVVGRCMDRRSTANDLVVRRWSLPQALDGGAMHRQVTRLVQYDAPSVCSCMLPRSESRKCIQCLISEGNYLHLQSFTSTKISSLTRRMKSVYLKK